MGSTAPRVEQEASERIITVTLHSNKHAEAQPPRPPRGWKHKKNMRTAYIVHTLAFCIVMFLFGVLSLTLPKPTVSEVEKRELAVMPDFSVEALIGGSYTRELEMHYADTFPLREGFVSFAALLDEIKGVRFDDVKIYGTAPAAEETPERRPVPVPVPVPENTVPAASPPGADSDSEESISEPSQPEPREIHRESDDAAATGEQNGSVFVYKGRGMSMFGGSKGMAEWYAEAINAYHKKWGKDVQIYNIVVPTAIEFLLPEKYQSVTSPQKPNIDHIYESLDDGIRGVDAYTAIGVHADEYVYFNADHHWTALGAYYAYTAFCESAGIKPLSLDDYDTRRLENFYGTMYTYTKDAKLDDDYVDYYIMPVECEAVRYDKGAPYTAKEHSVWAEYAKSPNSYSVFLHGDYPLIKISTENHNGKKALIVKESFGNAFAPFLIPHYEEVYIVDQRYFELNLTSYVTENGIDDVIFINNIFAANTGYHIKCIESML